MTPALQKLLTEREGRAAGTLGATMTRSVHNRRRNAWIIAVSALVIAIGYGIANSSFRGEPLPLESWWMAAVAPGQVTPWLTPSLVLHEIGAGLPAFVIASAVTGALFL